MRALYGWNDPTGILLNFRGWALHDQWTGLIDRPRLPDAYARTRDQPIPYRTWEFLEIDKRVGWYAGASWDEVGIGHLDILYYNNDADPTAETEQIAWETDFWNIGLSTEIGPVTLLAQGMRGRTFFQPSATLARALVRIRLSAGRVEHQRELACRRTGGGVLGQ